MVKKIAIVAALLILLVLPAKLGGGLFLGGTSVVGLGIFMYVEIIDWGDGNLIVRWHPFNVLLTTLSIAVLVLWAIPFRRASNK